MSDSNTTQRLLIDSLKKCNLLHHTVSLAKIGIRGHYDILCFDASFLSEASGINITDATTIINTVRNVSVQSTAQSSTTFIKQEPIDSDSDIEIISSKIPSSKSNQKYSYSCTSNIQQSQLQNDASSNSRNSENTANNMDNTDEVQVNRNTTHHLSQRPLSPQSHLSKSLDENRTSLCHQTFENQELLCAHAIASMQNNGCNVATTTNTQVSVPLFRSPSASLSDMNPCIESIHQSSASNVNDFPQSMQLNIDQQNVETTSNSVITSNDTHSNNIAVLEQALCTQQSHVSVRYNDEDIIDTQMDLNLSFDFDSWIADNELGDIRHIFMKYGMINTDTITPQSDQFKKFIFDPEVIANPTKMALAIKAIQKLCDANHEMNINVSNTSWKCKEVQKVNKKRKQHKTYNVDGLFTEDADISDTANTNNMETNTNNMETPMGDDDNKYATNTDTEMDSNASQHSESDAQTVKTSSSKRNRDIMCYGCNNKFSSLYLKSKHECNMAEISISPPAPSVSPPPIFADVQDTDSCRCSDCGKSFENSKALGGHRNASKLCGYKRRTKKTLNEHKQYKEEKVKYENKARDHTPIRRRERKRKSYYTPTYKNKDGSQRAKRLLLNDALKDTKLKTEWSQARKKAWNKKDTNPELYYYRFNANEETVRNGKWDEHEKELFINRVKQIGVNSGWGNFSLSIPGRVGYMCSNQWRTLQQQQRARDQNYYFNENKRKLMFKWASNSNKGPNELMDIKKWSFSLLDDRGDIIYEKERENFQDIEKRFAKYLAKPYVEQMLQPPKKKRKIS